VTRNRNGTRRPKVRIGISPDPTLLEWVDQHIGPGKRFATRTHAFEAGISCLVQQVEEAVAMPTQRPANG
jgi:hypothetical protein